MKMLNVRFSEAQKLKLDDLSDVVDLDVSKVARAALKLGINQILTLGAVDKEKAKELVLINDALAK